MPRTDEILAQIDTAIADHEVSVDAVRCNPATAAHDAPPDRDADRQYEASAVPRRYVMGTAESEFTDTPQEN